MLATSGFNLLFEALNDIVNKCFKESPSVLQNQLRNIKIVHNKQLSTVDAQLTDTNLTFTYNLKV